MNGGTRGNSAAGYTFNSCTGTGLADFAFSN